jgi:superfamily II DNA or RNA helicase
MRLRDYQVEALEAVDRTFSDVDSALLVQPTGTGKTVCFSHAIKRQHGRSLVLAHRQELIFQAADKIARVTGERPDIEMADMVAAEDVDDGSTLWGSKKKCVVATVQTMIAGDPPRMERFDPTEFGLIVIDEAHHAPAVSYRKVIDYFTAENPHIKVLGVTATPDRADEMALGILFEQVAHVYEITDAVEDGYLVRPHVEMIEVDGLDFSHIKTTAGDLNQGQLGAAMEQATISMEEELHRIVAPTLELSRGRKTLIFTTTVAQAERTAEIINRHEPGSAHCISAKTPRDLRMQLLDEYRDGRFTTLVNVGVFTEGFDEPGVEVVVIARPTKSRSLYAQMIGRGTRPLPGVVDGLATPEERRQAIAQSAKPRLEVYDFVGNSGRHKLVSAADILGGNYDTDVVERAKAIAKEREGTGDVLMDLHDAAEQLAQEERERQKRQHIKANARFRQKKVDPFDVLDLKPVHNEPPWFQGKELSLKMRATLERNGIEPDAVTYTQAKQLIGEICARRDQKLCTLRQRKLLRRFGYHDDMKFDEAKRLIDSIASNGWRRPDGS